MKTDSCIDRQLLGAVWKFISRPHHKNAILVVRLFHATSVFFPGRSWGSFVHVCGGVGGMSGWFFS